MTLGAGLIALIKGTLHLTVNSVLLLFFSLFATGVSPALCQVDAKVHLDSAWLRRSLAGDG